MPTTDPSSNTTDEDSGGYCIWASSLRLIFNKDVLQEIHGRKLVTNELYSLCRLRRRTGAEEGGNARRAIRKYNIKKLFTRCVAEEEKEPVRTVNSYRN